MIIHVMQTYPQSLWPLRITTFALAALAAASAAYWVLNWVAVVPSGPTASLAGTGTAPVDPQAVARVLGGAGAGPGGMPVSAVPVAPNRYKLTGVVAGTSQRGYALISIDDQPARPFRVGSLVGDALVLQSVSARSAALGPSREAPAALTLDLPALAAR